MFVGGVERLAVADAGSEVASSDGGGSTGSAGVDAVAPAESASRPPTSQTEPGTVEVDPPGTVPGGTTPSDTLPVNTAPVTTVPGQAPPPDTTPVETVPVDVPAETIPVETVPVDPPEPEVAVLVDVRADFWWSWDEDGSIWLLPAYTFTDTEGRTHTVAAVTDEYLIVVEAPVPVEPMPMPDPDVPQTSPEPQVDPAEPVDTPSKVDTSGVVGLTVDEATKVLAERGLTLRVAREDGEDLAVTMDFVETRVNVATEDGVITEVLSVG